MPRKKELGMRNATRMSVAQKAAIRTGRSVAQAYDDFANFIDAMRDALLEHGTLELRGFGVFKVVTRKGRPGRNPRNPDQKVWIPDRNSIRFVPSVSFAEKLQTSEQKGFVPPATEVTTSQPQ